MLVMPLPLAAYQPSRKGGKISTASVQLMANAAKIWLITKESHLGNARRTCKYRANPTQSVTGKELSSASAITEDGARLDVTASGFWEGGVTSVPFLM